MTATAAQINEKIATYALETQEFIKERIQEAYEQGFRDGAEQMREQMHNLLKYTIHD
jgi:flagellar biosynthesis/type III secretory pathway protein FliH